MRGGLVRPGRRPGRRARRDPRAVTPSRPTAPPAASPSRRACSATTRARWGSPRAATTGRPYHPGPWFESWLDLWEGDLLLPGYGWLFPVAGGRVNLGAGLLNTFKDFKEVSAQRLFDAFATMLPADWEIDEEHAEGRVLSGPLPMGMNRVPQAVPGLLLVGDAAGVVNPFNGEGIAYAIETGEMAAELTARGARDGPAGPHDDVSRRCCGSATATTSRSGAGSRA